MMHIVFCINKRFVMPCWVLIKSILHYNETSVSFHVISDDIDESDRTVLQSLVAENEDCFIRFYRLPPGSDSDFIVRERDYVSKETYYRLLIADVLDESISTVLYLDCDMVCTGNLRDLVLTDLARYPVAMCYDSQDVCESSDRLGYPVTDGYHNAGVMLMNLEYWRKTNLTKDFLSYLAVNKEKCFFHDQDVINAVLHGKILELDARYNFQPVFFNVFYWMNPDKYNYCADDEFIQKEKYPGILEAAKNPVLVHFCGNVKPWHKESSTPFTSVWRHFYSQSPWKDVKLKKRYGFKRQLKKIKKKLKAVFVDSRIAKKRDVPYPDEAYQVAQTFLETLKVRDTDFAK